MRQGDGLCRIGAGSHPLDAGMERAGMSTADSCRLLAFADMVKHKAAGGIAVGLATPFPHFRGRAVHRAPGPLLAPSVMPRPAIWLAPDRLVVMDIELIRLHDELHGAGVDDALIRG